MTDGLRIGERVRIFLDSKFWKSAGWFTGRIVRIDPYSHHRSFYWVELDAEVEPLQGGKTNLVSILNPKNIESI